MELNFFKKNPFHFFHQLRKSSFEHQFTHQIEPNNRSLEPNLAQQTQFWTPVWPRKPTLVFTSADKGASQKAKEEELGCLRLASIRSRGRARMV
jgi:hypothetical protein